MRRWLNIGIGVIFAAALILASFGPAAEAEETAADFYKGKVLKIATVGAGGGTDAFARLLALFWPKYTGVKSVVQNITGGGGLVSANVAYNANDGGLTLGVFPGDPIIARQLFNEAGRKYDIRDASWVGNFATTQYVLGVAKQLPYGSLKELKGAKKLVFGADNPASPMAMAASIVIEALEMKNTKIVTGYKNTAEQGLRMAAGELDFTVFSDNAFAHERDKGFVKPEPFCVISNKKNAWFPDAPLLPEVIELTPKVAELLQFVDRFAVGKVVYGSPDIPADRLQFLRDTFEKIVTDPDFKKKAKARFQILDYVRGEVFADQAKAIADVSPEKLKEYIYVLTEKYVVN